MGFSMPQRKWAMLSVGQEVGVRPYTFDKSRAYITQVSIVLKNYIVNENLRYLLLIKYCRLPSRLIILRRKTTQMMNLTVIKWQKNFRISLDTWLLHLDNLWPLGTVIKSSCRLKIDS